MATISSYQVEKNLHRPESHQLNFGASNSNLRTLTGDVTVSMYRHLLIDQLCLA